MALTVKSGATSAEALSEAVSSPQVTVTVAVYVPASLKVLETEELLPETAPLQL